MSYNLDGARVGQVLIHGGLHLLHLLVQVAMILLELPQLLQRQLK